MKVLEIGKLFLLMVWSATLYTYAPIGIDILDANGKKTDKIQLGMPFYIDIEVVTEEHTSHPKLIVDPAIITNLQGSRSSVYSINGYKTVSKNYRYTAQAHDEGVFTIGPAIVMIGGKPEESAIKEITVQMNTAGRDAVDNDTQAYLEISTDSQTVYKGQEVIFSLRLYMKGEDVHIDGIQEPTFTQCTASPLEGPVSGQEIINGTIYKYLEWKTKFYAHTAGTLVIPAICANISISIDRAHGTGDAMDFLGMVGSILGTRVQHKQIFSNALKLQVLELPPSDKKVTALGAFSSFTAKTNLENAQQGEGVVLTLELVGQGNFSMIQHPSLVLPEGLHYYDSNTAVNQLGAGISKKDFEYIIQGNKPGVYTIPAQECTYFDKNKYVYKTLITKPLELKIVGKKLETTAGSSANSHYDEASLQQASIAEIGNIEENSWQDVQSKALSLKLFLYALGCIFLGWIIIFIRFFYSNYREKNAPYRSYKIAFSEARKKVDIYKKEDAYYKLYILWIELFAVRLKLPNNAVTQERIQLALQQKGYDQTMIHEWNTFFMNIMAASYSDKSVLYAEDLYDQTMVWLDRLDGLV